MEGEALPIKSARLDVGKQSIDIIPNPDGQSCVATLKLPAGETQLRASFLDADGNEIVGAYYVYVNRIAD